MTRFADPEHSTPDIAVLCNQGAVIASEKFEAQALRPLVELLRVALVEGYKDFAEQVVETCKAYDT